MVDASLDAYEPASRRIRGKESPTALVVLLCQCSLMAGDRHDGFVEMSSEDRNSCVPCWVTPPRTFLLPFG
jgi:hypothetical protein